MDRFVAASGALLFLVAAGATWLALCAVSGEPWSGADRGAMTGKELYRSACASCHGTDGTGARKGVVGFSEPVPDFTDCSFATREPDADWFGIVHDGGPVRGFARMMPALGDVLEDREIQAILDHVRAFCADPAWPRGELNLPRPLVTEKAFPEDEVVWELNLSTTGGPGEIGGQLVYEKRFGARNQYEVLAPVAWRESVPGHEEDSWVGGVGDLGVALKRVLHHDLDSGRILGLIGEMKLPTGNEEEGFGSGTTIFEPFLVYGQILPGAAFVHLQGGFELPLESGDAGDEALLRTAVGRTFTEDRFGRTWSPMVEVLGARELTSGASVHWDLVPELQVTLNRRQHVRANVGVRLPLDGSGEVEEILFYLLWDWFDGGFFEGW